MPFEISILRGGDERTVDRFGSEKEYFIRKKPSDTYFLLWCFYYDENRSMSDVQCPMSITLFHTIAFSRGTTR